MNIKNLINILKGNLFIFYFILKCAEILVERGIRFVAVLNGGVQSAKLDAPELLKIKGKATPIAFYKKELKR